MPKVDYPALFAGGLVGARAERPIEHREAFMSVPFHLIISVESARAHPLLAPVLSDNPHLFCARWRGDHEQLTLTVCLLYEYLRGAQSFWKPYLDMLPDVRLFCLWPPQVIAEGQDAYMLRKAEEFRGDLESLWLEIEQVLAKYPQIFPR